jgi:DNA repair protein RadA/Sms
MEECILDPNALTPGGRGTDTPVIVKPVPLASVSAAGSSRLATGIAELDRVLGGGAMKRE